MKTAVLHALLVGCGGFLGALLRYGVRGLVQRSVPAASFPYGTLCANLLGCLLIGVLAGLVESRQLFTPEQRAFVFVGVLGGFTTFSTFGFETVALARDGALLAAIANVGVHVVLGLALVWWGYELTHAS